MIRDEWVEVMVKIEEIECMEPMIMTKGPPLEVENHRILEDHRSQKKFINVQITVAVDLVATEIEMTIMLVQIQLVDDSTIMVVVEVIVSDRMMADIFHLRITRNDRDLQWTNLKAIEIRLKIIIMMKCGVDMAITNVTDSEIRVRATVDFIKLADDEVAMLIATI